MGPLARTSPAVGSHLLSVAGCRGPFGALQCSTERGGAPAFTGSSSRVGTEQKARDAPKEVAGSGLATAEGSRVTRRKVRAGVS